VKEETITNIIVGTVIAVILTAVLYALVYIWVSVDARQDCHEAGWMKHKVDLNFTRYCTSRIQGSDIIVPFDEAVKSGNMNNLWLREIFRDGGIEMFGYEQEAAK
jgi:hypothetical protein